MRIDLGWYLRQRPNLPRNRFVALLHILHNRGRFRTSRGDVPSSRAHQDSFPDKVARLRERVAAGAKIRSVFLVSNAAVFPSRWMFERMMADGRFSPQIVVLPFPESPEDTRTGDELRSRYGNELVRFAKSDDEWVDPAKIADIVFYNSPYDAVHPFYCVRHSLKRDFLPVMVAYGYPRSNYDNRVYAMDSYADCWKVLIENETNLDEYRRHSVIGGRNALLTGYVKMDGYAEIRRASKKRPCVLIAPHHSVEGGYNKILGLSNFLRYADDFLELPRRYPTVDFVFRPHPVLFTVLRDRRIWTEAKIADWKRRMNAHPNVRWSEGGDAFRDFAEADVLVHDCGSFLVEWFYTGKPQCYMLKSPKDIGRKFTAFGQECLSHCSKAYDFAAVERFIDEVAVKGMDPEAASRRAFARERVMVNYPDASGCALELLTREIQSEGRIR